MKNLFLFIGVIMICLLFSCKKDSTQTPTPPPPIDSLPIPITIGTWWNYQRIDSVDLPLYAGSNYNPIHYIDTSIEIITVIGKAPYEDLANNISKVESILMQVQNLTKGTLDTIYAFYFNPDTYNTYFMIQSNKDNLNLLIKIPLVEGTNRLLKPITGYDYEDYTSMKNSSVSVFNKSIDGCIYTEDFQYRWGAHKSNDYKVKTFLKPSIGFIYWEVLDILYADHSAPYTKLHYRKLIDYHIAP